ncbi:MAG: leucine-rich repeat domain-containing protein, partial [Anaeroplasmataceae bacterium]|nr:leucine-rich repeat domain-containing protein [Anaeroplasmataceae bacterium]
LPYSLTTFEDEAFMNTGIPSIIINPDVLKVGKRVFAECLNLETVYNYPNFLGEGMFEGSTNLKHVYLYKDMEEIANRAFADCTNLLNVTLTKDRPLSFEDQTAEKPIQKDWYWWVMAPSGEYVKTNISTVKDLKLQPEIKNGKWYIGGIDTGYAADTQTGSPVAGSDYYWYVGDQKTSILTIQRIANTLQADHFFIGDNRNWFIVKGNEAIDTGISAYQETSATTYEIKDFYYWIDGKNTSIMSIIPSTDTPVRGEDGFWHIGSTATSAPSRRLVDPATSTNNSVTYQVTNGKKYATNLNLSWETYPYTLANEDGSSKVVQCFVLYSTDSEGKKTEIEKTTIQATYEVITDDQGLPSGTKVNNTPKIETVSYWRIYDTYETNLRKSSSDVWSVVDGKLALNGVATEYDPQYVNLDNMPTLSTTDYYWHDSEGNPILKGYEEKDAPTAVRDGFNWQLVWTDGTTIDTGIDGYERTGLIPSLKNIKSGDTIIEDDLYWYIGNQKTTVLGYENKDLSYSIEKVGNNYYWFVGDTNTSITIPAPTVNKDDLYWYVGENKTTIWSVDYTDEAKNNKYSIGKDHLWYIGKESTGISCVRNFNPTIYGDFIYSSGNTTTPLTELPAGLDRIGISSFENCKNIEYVVLQGIEAIDTRAFYGCDKLNHLIIPDSLTEYQVQTVIDSETGEEIEIVIGGVGSSVFENCTSLTDLTLESKNLGDYMFAGCTSLVKVVFEDEYGLTRTPTGIFKGATSLSDVTLPETLIIVGESSFEDCSGLKEIELPDTVTTLEDYAFRNSGLETIIIPKSVVNIGTEVLAHCSNLKDIIFKNKSLGDSMLLDCTGL